MVFRGRRREREGKGRGGGWLLYAIHLYRTNRTNGIEERRYVWSGRRAEGKMER